MQTMRKVLVATAVMMAAAFPAVAQQDEPSAPSESTPQAGTDQKADQPVPGGMTGGMMKQGEMMHHGSMKGRMMCDKRGMREGRGMMPPSVPMMEGRLAYVKADLEITDAQTPAWNAYADAVRSRRTKMLDVHADMMKAKESGNAVERMDARIKGLEARLDGLKALKPATEALYAALSDEQKEKADHLLAGRGGVM